MMAITATVIGTILGYLLSFLTSHREFKKRIVIELIDIAAEYETVLRRKGTHSNEGTAYKDSTEDKLQELKLKLEYRLKYLHVKKVDRYINDLDKLHALVASKWRFF